MTLDGNCPMAPTQINHGLLRPRLARADLDSRADYIADALTAGLTLMERKEYVISRADSAIVPAVNDLCR